MSRKYKFKNPEGIYFISFATVFWIDVFVREQYFNTIAESLDFCIKEKGMELFAYCERGRFFRQFVNIVLIFEICK